MNFTPAQRFVLDTMIELREALTTYSCAAHCVRRLRIANATSSVRILNGESVRVRMRELARMGLISRVGRVNDDAGDSRGRSHMRKQLWQVERSALTRLRREDEEARRGSESVQALRDLIAAADDDSEAARCAFVIAMDNARRIVSQIERAAGSNLSLTL